MNASVTSTEMLKFVTPPSSLHSMNSRMSGWSTRSTPMLAPRRVPPCFTASVAALNTGMRDTRPGAREGEACAPARLVNDGRGLDRVEDLGHGIADGQDVAGRVLEMIVLARVHEGRRVWKKLPFHHHVVEGRGDLADSGQAPAKALFGARDCQGHPPAHLLGGLRRLTIAAGQVAFPQHPQGRLRPAPHPRRSS